MVKYLNLYTLKFCGCTSELFARSDRAVLWPLAQIKQMIVRLGLLLPSNLPTCLGSLSILLTEQYFFTTRPGSETSAIAFSVLTYATVQTFDCLAAGRRGRTFFANDLLFHTHAADTLESSRANAFSSCVAGRISLARLGTRNFHSLLTQNAGEAALAAASVSTGTNSSVFTSACLV